MESKVTKYCSICQGPIDVQLNGWADGHNAEPVNKGRCCSACNASVVIPARIKAMRVSGKGPWPTVRFLGSGLE